MSKVSLFVLTESKSESETKSQTESKIESKTESKSESKTKEYIQSGNEYVYVQTDVNGNIYLKHKNKYYIVSLDDDEKSGINLTLINNPAIFRRKLQDNIELLKTIKSGIIRSGHKTLKGIIADNIDHDGNNNDNSDDLDELDYQYQKDDQFTERGLYWVKYNLDDEPNEFESNETYYLNGVVNDTNNEGIIMSDLLASYPGTFDTLLMKGHSTDSKTVISSIERIDGHCSKRLTIYTCGNFKANFIDKSKYSKLCYNPKSDSIYFESIHN
jgi:hypothetical protein